MKILCPHCSTPYALADGSIGPEGRMVRCARCGVPWRAFPAEDMAEAGGIATVTASAATVIEATDIVVASPPLATLAPPEPMAVLTLPAEVHSRRAAPSASPPQARIVGRPPPRPKPRRRVAARIGGPLALAAALALTAGAIVFREPIVGGVHDLAGLYQLAGLGVNLRGLEFRDVTAARSVENGAPVLVVAGEIANVSAGEVDLPAIRLALRASGAQEVYAWSVQLGSDRLPAGDSLPFRTRVASPPDARDLELRFADRPAAGAGEPR